MEGVMDARTIVTAETLLEAARILTPLQRQIMQSLYDKGPCLLLELAVHVLKFPEEISQSVQELWDKGLIHAEAFSGGQFGGELLSLSEQDKRGCASAQGCSGAEESARSDQKRATADCRA
jgi:predicted transcriptional regulator